MKIGYVTASDHVIKDSMPIGYMYREEPDNESDSGWRVFSGEESQEYADNPQNFSLYNATTIVDLDSQIAEFLNLEYPVSLERNPLTSKMTIIED